MSEPVQPYQQEESESQVYSNDTRGVVRQRVDRGRVRGRPVPGSGAPVPVDYSRMDMYELSANWDNIPTQDRQAILEDIQATYGGGFNSTDDANAFYMLALRHQELQGINTRTPANWDSPEVQQHYQEVVVRSAVASAQRQAQYDAMSAQEKQLRRMGLSEEKVAEVTWQLQSKGVLEGEVAFVDTFEVSVRDLDVISAENQRIKEAYLAGDSRITAEGLQKLVTYQVASKQAAEFDTYLRAEGYQLSGGSVTAGTFFDASGQMVVGLSDYGFEQSGVWSKQDLDLAVGFQGKLALMGQTEEGRRSVYQGFLLSGAVIGAVVVAPFTGGLSLVGTAKVVGVGAGLGVGVSQGFKTGAAVFERGASWETVRGSALSPLEAVTAGATGVLFMGAFPAATGAFGLAGRGAAGVAGRVGVGAGLGAAGAGLSEGILTGEVTWQNVAVGAVVGGVLVGGSEFLGFVNNKFIKPRVETRIDSNIAKSFSTTEYGSQNPSKFLETYKMPFSDRMLSRVTGATKPTNFEMVFADSGISNNSVTTLAKVDNVPINTGSMLKPDGMAFYRGSTIVNTYFVSDSLKLTGIIDRTTGKNLLTGQQVFAPSNVASSGGGSGGSVFPLKLGTARIPVEVPVTQASASTGIVATSSNVATSSSSTVVTWRGLYWQGSSGVARPLLGRGSSVPSGAIVQTGYVPESALDASIMLDTMKKTGTYDPSSVQVFEDSIKLMSQINKVGSNYFTGRTPTSIGVINDQGLLAVKEYTIRNPELFDRYSGTFSAVEQYRKDKVYTYTDSVTGETIESTKPPNDLDPLMRDQAAAEKATQDVYQILLNTGNRVRINPNRSTLIDVSVGRDVGGREVWAHGWDAHVAGNVGVDGALGDVQQVPSTAFGRQLDRNRPLIADRGLVAELPDAGVPIRRLSDQTTAKLFGSLIPSKTVDGQGRIGTLPHRRKDAVGAAIGVDTLLSSKGLDPSRSVELQRFMRHHNLTSQDLAEGVAAGGAGLSENFVTVPTRDQLIRTRLNELVFRGVGGSSGGRSLVAGRGGLAVGRPEVDLTTIGTGRGGLAMSDRGGGLLDYVQGRRRPYVFGAYVLGVSRQSRYANRSPDPVAEVPDYGYVAEVPDVSSPPYLSGSGGSPSPVLRSPSYGIDSPVAHSTSESPAPYVPRSPSAPYVSGLPYGSLPSVLPPYGSATVVSSSDLGGIGLRFLDSEGDKRKTKQKNKTIKTKHKRQERRAPVASVNQVLKRSKFRW